MLAGGYLYGEERAQRITAAQPPLFPFDTGETLGSLALGLWSALHRPVRVFVFYVLLSFSYLSHCNLPNWEAFQEAAADVHGVSMLRAAIMIMCRSLVLLFDTWASCSTPLSTCYWLRKVADV